MVTSSAKNSTTSKETAPGVQLVGGGDGDAGGGDDGNGGGDDGDVVNTIDSKQGGVVSRVPVSKVWNTTYKLYLSKIVVRTPVGIQFVFR